MPVIRQDALPITREALAELRERLAKPYQFERVERDESRCLFLRSPREEPDPVADLEACLERVPDWAARDLTDVFLLGQRASFHVPGHHAQPFLDRRQRIDAGAVAQLRAELDRNYAIELHRVPGDLQNLVRLGLRLPRARVAELEESDLLKLARSVGPLLDAGDGRHVQVAYLIADEDHLRLPGDDLIADLRPRWDELQRAPPPAPSPEPPAPIEEPKRTPAPPRRRPKKVINVAPVLEFETEVYASLPDELALKTIKLAESNLEALLQAKEYQVLKHVAHGGDVFALAAERAAVYPRRVLVRTAPFFAKTDADHVLRCVRELEADLLIVLALEAAPEAIRRTLATKVKVIRPDQVASLSL